MSNSQFWGAHASRRNELCLLLWFRGEGDPNRKVRFSETEKPTGETPVLPRRARCCRVILSAVFLMFAFASCARTPDTRTHILIWHQKIAGERDLFHEQIARFNAAHPETVVETLYKENEELRNLFVIAAVAGQGPDLIYGPADNVGVFVTTRTVLPLDTVLPKDFFGRFVPQGIVSWRDKPWLIAYQLGNQLIQV